MKRNSNLVLVLLTIILSAALVIGCGDVEREEEVTGFDHLPVGKWTDWTLEPGDGNEFDESKFKLELVKDEEDNGSLKVVWGAQAIWTATLFSATLPDGVDYSQFDGLFLKVKLPMREGNFTFNIIADLGNGDIPFEHSEGMVFVGDANVDKWYTVTKRFNNNWGKSQYWGEPYTGNILQFLKEATNVEKTIRINPQIGINNASMVNQEITIYFDDIGFYKGNVNNADDRYVIWDFED